MESAERRALVERQAAELRRQVEAARNRQIGVDAGPHGADREGLAGARRVSVVEGGTGCPSRASAQGAPATATRAEPPSAVKVPPSSMNSIAAAPGALPTSALAAASASRSMAPELETP